MSEDQGKRAAFTWAASYEEGDARAALLAKAAPEKGKSHSKKTREEENLGRWSLNPSNPDLREIGTQTIIKNIYQFGSIENPAADVYYTLLAI